MIPRMMGSSSAVPRRLSADEEQLSEREDAPSSASRLENRQGERLTGLCRRLRVLGPETCRQIGTDIQEAMAGLANDPSNVRAKRDFIGTMRAAISAIHEEEIGIESESNGAESAKKKELQKICITLGDIALEVAADENLTGEADRENLQDIAHMRQSTMQRHLEAKFPGREVRVLTLEEGVRFLRDNPDASLLAIQWGDDEKISYKQVKLDEDGQKLCAMDGQSFESKKCLLNFLAENGANGKTREPFLDELTADLLRTEPKNLQNDDQFRKFIEKLCLLSERIRNSRTREKNSRAYVEEGVEILSAIGKKVMGVGALWHNKHLATGLGEKEVSDAYAGALRGVWKDEGILKEHLKATFKNSPPPTPNPPEADSDSSEASESDLTNPFDSDSPSSHSSTDATEETDSFESSSSESNSDYSDDEW